jgi:hypothetical protein
MLVHNDKQVERSKSFDYPSKKNNIVFDDNEQHIKRTNSFNPSKKSSLLSFDNKRFIKRTNSFNSSIKK